MIHVVERCGAVAKQRPKPRFAELPQMCADGETMFFRSREDLLRSKLFALCDRGIDLADCIALAPTIGELAALRPWLDRQDGNPDWPAHVGEVLDDLRKRLSHGV